MSLPPMGIDLAIEAMFAGAARGGASRQSMAAMAAAVIRTTWLGPPVEADIDSTIATEVVARIGMSVPALVSKVCGKYPSGGARAFRNCAWHAGLGGGAASLPKSEAQAKQLQRGARSESPKDHLPASSDPWLIADPWGGKSLQPGLTRDCGTRQWQYYRPLSGQPPAVAEPLPLPAAYGFVSEVPSRFF